MTPEEMDRKIAEHVGTADRWLIVKRGYFYRPEAKGYTSSKSEAWKLPLAEAKKHERLIGEERVTLSRASIPAYSTDLNAMREAEQHLFTRYHDTKAVFIDRLCRILDPVSGYRKQGAIDIIDATAEQHARAFVETIGQLKP